MHEAIAVVGAVGRGVAVDDEVVQDVEVGLLEVELGGDDMRGARDAG